MGKEGKAKGRRGTGGGEVGSDRRRRRHRRSSGPKPCASLPASLSAPDSFKILLLLLTLQFRGESETKGRTTAAEQKAGNRAPRGRAHGPAPRGRRPALPELQPLQPATPGFVQSSHLLEWEDESGSCDSVMAGGGNSFPNLKRSFRMIQGKKKKTQQLGATWKGPGDPVSDFPSRLISRPFLPHHGLRPHTVIQSSQIGVAVCTFVHSVTLSPL